MDETSGRKIDEGRARSDVREQERGKEERREDDKEVRWTVNREKAEGG